MRKLGYDLIKKRQQLGMSQVQVAKHLGLIQSTYCHYESGKVSPKGVRKQIIEQWLNEK